KRIKIRPPPHNRTSPRRSHGKPCFPTRRRRATFARASVPPPMNCRATPSTPRGGMPRVGNCTDAGRDGTEGVGDSLARKNAVQSELRAHQCFFQSANRHCSIMLSDRFARSIAPPIARAACAAVLIVAYSASVPRAAAAEPDFLPVGKETVV